MNLEQEEHRKPVARTVVYEAVTKERSRVPTVYMLRMVRTAACAFTIEVRMRWSALSSWAKTPTMSAGTIKIIKSTSATEAVLLPPLMKRASKWARSVSMRIPSPQSTVSDEIDRSNFRRSFVPRFRRATGTQ